MPTGFPIAFKLHLHPSRISSNLRETLKMGSESRPFCSRCSKPARICLCVRLKSPPIDNPIAIIVLQHSLEKTHPLNSTRIARIGLKNISVVTVTDVNFQAQFLILPLDPNRDHPQMAKNGFDTPFTEESLDFTNPQSAISTVSETSIASSSSIGQFQSEELGFEISRIPSNCKQIGDSLIDDEVTANFSNYTVTYSSKYISVVIERTAKPDIGWILNYPVGRAAISNGFTVKKLQRKEISRGSENFEDFEEFNLLVPPGSVLLFPSADSMELMELDFEIKQLIVLDGTWAKARRMYYENPWLKLLPQLKLDSTKASLYSEVRHQPKPGCLSTIESIVCALKGSGNDMEGLDQILEVFESMILDQRRCKDEKFKKMLES